MPLSKINGQLLYFVHIPKTGGSCITSYLRAKGPLALYSRDPVEWSKTTPQHLDAATQRVLLPERFYDHSFAILRNPFERLLSEYRYRAMRGNHANNIPDHLTASDALTVEFDWDKAFTGTFDQWVKRIFSDQISDPYLCDNHIRPQNEFLRPTAKIFLFEDGLEQVFTWIDHVTGTERTLIALDRNTSPQFSIQILEETRKMILAFYHKDFLLIQRIQAARTPESESCPK